MIKMLVLAGAALGILAQNASANDFQRLENACNAGNGSACGELGARYCSPWSRIDCARGKELLEKSCSLNVANACGALGSMYEDGMIPGAGKDNTKALGYYEMSCNLGSREYCLIIGLRYKNGKHPDGVNNEKARIYLKKACDLGQEDACYILENLN